MAKQELSAPFIGIVRHRLATDGKGVTTLAAFHGCPLRCKYCLNPQCLDPKMVWRNITTSQLLDELLLDNLYFLATGGGVTFGGGEPLLRSEFIDEFCRIKVPEWKVNIETSLNVDRSHLAGCSSMTACRRGLSCACHTSQATTPRTTSTTATPY